MAERRWGLSLDLPGLSLGEAAPVIRAAEQAGYTDGWPGEVSGHDGFTPVAVAATCTERMQLGTGVVNVFTRGPGVLAQHAASMQQLSGGRFSLGIGSSSNVIVERWNGIPFERPRTRVRETVEFLRAALAGERAGEGRFKLELPPEQPVPIVIAALRERMLQTAGELGDGVFLNFLPLSNVDTVLEEVRKGEREGGKEEGSTDAFCRFFCIQGDPEQTIGIARWIFCAYATVPVYEQFFRWLGYGDDIDPMVEAWRSGDRGKALEVAPQELIEEIFVLGEPDAQRARLEQYRERGVTVPVLLLVPGGGPGTGVGADIYGELVEALAPGS
ncbi:MAG TPA: LLM class F420-dependent oxidoreductase [Thermoleophilaceae bacterium]|nr:LLM class F420-dependent oxidoreductase [Thermoleophilaceae bacterium]